jgi:ParB-like chromosome segregation protein Spo0J
MISKYQKFTTKTISRTDIENAPYNPRVMDDKAKKRLKDVLKKHGLVQPIIVNARNNRIVGGHQRLEQLDALEKTQDYELEVALVDVDGKEEAEINLMLNNSSITGDFDFFKVAEITQNFKLDLTDVGFTLEDINILEAEVNIDLQPEIPEALVSDLEGFIKEPKQPKTEPTQEAKQELYDKVDQSRRDFKERDREKSNNETNSFIVVNFDDVKQKETFLNRNGFNSDTRHLSFNLLKGLDMYIYDGNS